LLQDRDSASDDRRRVDLAPFEIAASDAAPVLIVTVLTSAGDNPCETSE
jgi:hypothetical protein